MFGHSDNQQTNNVTNGQDTGATGAEPIAQDSSLEAPDTSYNQSSIPSAPLPASPFPPQNPFTTPSATSNPITKPDLSAGSSATTPASTGTPVDNGLLDIKQKALQELSPLVDHLEQTPEEKFKTTMMMIQASDDQSLLPAAYDAAQAITDEKAKAQALLDVVNEINYFTQTK